MTMKTRRGFRAGLRRGRTGDLAHEYTAARQIQHRSRRCASFFEEGSISKGNAMLKRSISIRAKSLLILMPLLLLSIPAGAQIDNCCFVDRQCTTNEQWVSGYYAFQNHQCAAPADSAQRTSSPSQPQSEQAPTASAAIDNCCYVDRLCQTDEEWVNGYNAYQNNQCGAPSQQRRSTPSQTQPQTRTSQNADNCCFIGWQCNTDEEWTSGYWAFQNDHCAIQSHWEEQWPRRQSGNQQQSSSGIQQDPVTRTTRSEHEDGKRSSARPEWFREWCDFHLVIRVPQPPECLEN